jgi:phosphatidylinositol glycan class B
VRGTPGAEGPARTRGLLSRLLGAGGLLHDTEWRRFLRRWLSLSLLLILVTASRSEGFHHPDEHFQTLEFMNYKQGGITARDLPWEFSQRMRPWLQPALYYAVARVWTTLGIRDRFSWALGFRLLSGVLGWLSVAGLALCAYRWFPGERPRQASIRALCLLWFIPYLAVRTSSESLSTSCLVLGMCLLLLGSEPAAERPRDWPARLLALVGCLFGLAFQFRYATGLMAASVTAWAVFVAGLPLAGILEIAAGFAPTLALGALIDRWGYGEWALPPCQYVLKNIGEGLAAQRFGASPWYAYFALPLETALAPLALVLILTLILTWLRHPRHVLTWATLPFVLVHLLLAHKEVRFLFPVAFLTPLCLVLAISPGEDGWDAWLRPLWAARRHLAVRALFGLNLLALAVLCLAPIRLELEFQKYVYRHFPDGFEAYLLTHSPYDRGLPMYFYRPARLELHPIDSVDEMVPASFYLVTDSFDDLAILDHAHDCRVLYRSFPEWVRHLDWFDWQARTPTWKLCQCTKKAPRETAPHAEIGPPSAIPVVTQ